MTTVIIDFIDFDDQKVNWMYAIKIQSNWTIRGMSCCNILDYIYTKSWLWAVGILHEG
jgi:hypothetical protein